MYAFGIDFEENVTVTVRTNVKGKKCILFGIFNTLANFLFTSKVCVGYLKIDLRCQLIPDCQRQDL